MKLLALDLSLRCSGWASSTECGTLVPPKGRDRGLPRLAWIRDEVLAKAVPCSLVIVEGLAFGAQGRAMLDLAGLAAVIRLALFESGTPFVDVPPSVLKKFATGKGNAKKDEVLAAAIRRLSYAGHDGNEADALWLLHAGLCHYDLPRAVDVPRAQRESLAVIPWPKRGT